MQGFHGSAEDVVKGGTLDKGTAQALNGRVFEDIWHVWKHGSTVKSRTGS